MFYQKRLYVSLKTIIRFIKNDYTFYKKQLYIKPKQHLPSLHTPTYDNEKNMHLHLIYYSPYTEQRKRYPDFTRTFRKKLYICGTFAKQQCWL